MLHRVLLAVGICSAIAFASGLPWDKPPEQWTQADVFKILRDSPWSPAKFSIESEYSQQHRDSASGAASDSQVHTRDAAVLPGVMLSRAHPLPSVTVLWWSSRTIRLAESKRLDSGSAAGKEKIDTGEAADYILAIEGDEPQRILRDAQGDLHDSVFLELESGGTLDFTAVKFVDDTDTRLRTEFHFPRGLDGQPAIDPEAERVIFHCRANAKKEMPGRSNSLSFRTEFSPRAMKAQGHPDL